MPKSRKKKDAIKVLIPEKPTANLTSAMRTELYATPESFENTTVQTISTNIAIQNSDKELPKLPFKKADKNASKDSVEITKVNDVLTYDTDLIGTYSQSSGTVSYDSIKSMNDDSVEKAKINGKYVENTGNDLHKIVIEQLLDDSSIARMRVISDNELNRQIIQQEALSEKQQAIPATPLWGLYENILAKKCLNEVVENFFACPRDDIELTMRLTRRDMYPRLHIELASIYKDHLQFEAAHFQQNAIVPFVKNRIWRFDNLLRTEDFNDYLSSKDLSMQSMENRSASMCCAQSSDATTARSSSYDYISSAYSYLVAFVKSVVPSRSYTSTKSSNDNK